MRFTHEYDAKGNHRLVITLGHQVLTTGNWQGYRAPCIAILESDTYMAFTDYFAGDWEPDMVYHISTRGKANTTESQVEEMEDTASA